jgi:hypothetical protein
VDDHERVPTTWDVIAGWFAPRRYTLTRFLILRLLGIVYTFAFLGLIFQGRALLGSHGLTPVSLFVDRLHQGGQTFWDVPSLFMLDSSDAALTTWAYVGLVLAIACALGYANMPSLLVLWAIYGSYERVGQLWFAFGWEIQLLETTLIAAFVAHPWDPRPLAARPPPIEAIALMRWLVFRVMLGAGLIKWRGDACWRELTCLDWHFETQPIPNPLSPWFHHLPHGVLAVGVAFNHVVELVLPWFVFGPRVARLIAGSAMLAFQVTLILSGNLAFLNWLTVVPILACFDDDFVLRLLPARARVWVGARGARVAVAAPSRYSGHRIAVRVFALVVVVKSCAVVDNMLAIGHPQAMNRSFDRLALVNTYGAFGSVDSVRHELVIEGTLAEDPTAPGTDWRAYELPCKPGDLARRPCLLGPYHRRLDWLIWFSAMEAQPRDAWIVHLVAKLLAADPVVRELMADDPFDGKPPKWVRIRRFVYHFAASGDPDWWTRDSEEVWLPPVARDSPALQEVLRRDGWDE